MRAYSIFLLCASLLLPCSASAQDINLLPEGQTLITLSVTEQRMVPQDLLRASLRIEGEDRDAAALQDHINSTMEAALEQARGVDEVKVSTGSYSVYQYNRSQSSRADMIWRGSQTITLEGEDAEKLLALTGELQEAGLVMNHLAWELSPQRADEVRDSLMEAAIARATEKAGRAGQAMGKPDVEVAILEIDSPPNFNRPMMMRAMAEQADMTAPVAEAGESEVTLTVRVQAVAQAR